MKFSFKTASLAAASVITLALIAGSASAEIKGEAIRVGVLTDMNGVFATAMGSGSVEAARMAAEDFGGSINGKPIEILQADHQNKPDIASSLARKWFDRDNVQAIADGGSSGAALAVQELVRARQGVPGVRRRRQRADRRGMCLDQHAMDPGCLFDRNCRRVRRDEDQQGAVVLHHGGLRLGHSIEATARARVGELGGAVAGSVKTPLGTADFGSALLQAQSSGAKILALNAAGDNATAMKQAAESGLAQQGMKIVPMSFQNVDIYSVGLKIAQGNLILTSFLDVSPAARTWSDRFFARHKAMPARFRPASIPR